MDAKNLLLAAAPALKDAQAKEGQCHGMNSCKGKGWLKTSEKECKEKKGTFKKA